VPISLVFIHDFFNDLEKFFISRSFQTITFSLIIGIYMNLIPLSK
jgi:hypothetical protein